jgi:3-oxoacyl-[acyl-carrier-protein] synthase II
LEWLNDVNAPSLIGGVGDVAGRIAWDLGMHSGPRLVISTACASGMQAVIRGAMMIRFGEAQRVLVIGCEASVHELFVGSSQRLGVGAPAGMRCRPFDENRKGFLTSEAGAAICLEKAEGDGGGDDGGKVCIERFALGGDGLHLTGLDPAGATLGRLMGEVMGGRAVDLVHAHGTGTIQNDEVELAVIERCVGAAGGRRAILYSHKGALGHTLGAAGVVSIVLNSVAHRTDTVPPSLASAPMEMRNVRLSASGEMARIRRSIAMAAGFGGAVGVVSLIST